jgi:hypothetical protein
MKWQEYLTGFAERRDQEVALGWIIPVMPAHRNDVASQELLNDLNSLGI